MPSHRGQLPCSVCFAPLGDGKGTTSSHAHESVRTSAPDAHSVTHSGKICGSPRFALFRMVRCSEAQTGEPRPRPLHHPALLRSFGWSPSPACAGADEFLRSRDALASELCHTTARRTALHKSEGRRSAGRRNPTIGRIGGCGRALSASALASRRSTAALATLLGLAQPRAALPGITGCKLEDPPRRQCSEHLAGRS
jgi:hypothetical protein